MSLKYKIPAAEIASMFGELAAQVEKELKTRANDLIALTHAEVLERSQKELHSTAKTFRDHFHYEQIAENVWVISVDEEALFIEDGIKPGTDMKEWLLKDAKVNAKGEKYKIVPFDWTKGPKNMSKANQNLLGQLQAKFKENKIPFKKLETNADGSPRVSNKAIHSLNMGGPKPGKGNTPAFDRVNVYQTKTDSGAIRRDIFTFRTVTSGSKGKNKWIHPGTKPHNYLDQAYELFVQKWETEVLPNILQKWESK